MDLATALIWTLRIVLPIILFCIYFKLQTPKDERCEGPTDNVHDRTTLLALRKATVGASTPPSMQNIALKDQDQAPELFAVGRGGKGGGRRGADDSRSERSERVPREGREKREKAPRKEQEVAEEPEPSATKEIDHVVDASKDKMHLESLLNYVAFNRKDQQRTFLLETNGAPPPPPPPSKKEHVGSAISSAIFGSTAAEANAEAQMVLRGAIGIQRSDVARHLHAQLEEARVAIWESTFVLMIDLCLFAVDLKGASDFLMKMEGAGHFPSSGLLDKVMQLYLQQKSAREEDKVLKASSPQDDGLVSDAVVPGLIHPGDPGPTKLSSQAPVFVPSFIPAPPPKASGEPANDIVGLDKAEELLKLQKTKLSAEFTPFEPKFNVTFDPFMYTWTVNPEDEQEFYKGQNGEGSWDVGKAWHESKGREKGKGRGRGKGHIDGKGGEVNHLNGKGKGKDVNSRANDKSWEANWSSDAAWARETNWKSDAKWAPDEIWDFDTKALTRKWIVKVSKETEEHANSDDSTREGYRYAAKTWKPKVESVDKIEAPEAIEVK